MVRDEWKNISYYNMKSHLNYEIFIKIINIYDLYYKNNNCKNNNDDNNGDNKNYVPDLSIITLDKLLYKMIKYDDVFCSIYLKKFYS